MGEHKEAQAVLVSSIAAYCRNRERKTKSAYHSQGPMIQVVLSRHSGLQIFYANMTRSVFGRLYKVQIG